ncbi:streptophobe family protein [Streptomyces sp. NPDC048288]|uniref:streptophobe family protein n=1 Tax=Streptomyces sp. NPDC048288 TaxID=3365529 RepID=UPI0037124559
MSQHPALTSGATRPDTLPPRPARPPRGPRTPVAAGPAVTGLQNLIAGSGAAVAAFAAMLTVALLGLTLTGASSATSLVPAAVTLVCLAVGGSADFSGGSGGGLLSMGMAGGLRGMPLGVTLAGAVAVLPVFFRGLRGRKVTAETMFARVAAALVTWLVLLMVFSPFGRGSLELPQSLTAKVKPGSAGGGPGGGLGGLLGGGSGAGSGAGSGGGGLLGRLTGSGVGSGVGSGAGGGLLGGSGGSSSLSTVDFEADVAITVFAGLAWLLVVLLLGVAATRRPRFSIPFATGRLRTTLGPALSATASVLLPVTAALTAAGAVGAWFLAGDDGGKAAGTILLAAPNAVIAVLSTGIGASWTMSFQGVMDTSSTLGSLLSGLSGGGLLSGLTGSSGGGGFTPPHRTMSLADATGSPVVRLGLLLAVLAVLFACGILTAARTPVPLGRDGRPQQTTRATRAALTAVQTGLVWSVLFLAADLVGGPSMTATMSIMDSPLMNLTAGGGADSALTSVLLGLFAAGAAGFAGGFVQDAYRARRTRHAG